MLSRIWWFVGLFLVVGCLSEIRNVPYHRQITRYACGDASFEMVYHYYRQDVDQRAIIDVCRTSFHLGTNTFDIIRAGHFSHLSSAASTRYYPDQAPQNGWKSSLPYGMAAFGYYGETCWIDELKQVLAKGYPIIVLNHFSESDLGGHYRVAVDFDEDSITLLDPWDRFWPRIVSYTNEEFCEEIWFIPETYDDVTFPPFWAGFLSPLEVDVSFVAQNYSSSGRESNDFNYIRVSADIHYPCPAPFCTANNISDHEFMLHQTNVTLTVPENMKVLDNGERFLGDFLPSTAIQQYWEVQINDSFEKFDEVISSSIKVEVVGMLHASVPQAFCCFDEQHDGGKYYPSYSYSDIISGSGKIHY